MVRSRRSIVRTCVSRHVRSADLRVPDLSTAYTVDAGTDRRLSAEHVPPKAVGGRELLLTCRVCNNSAGTQLDADAKTKEDVRIAMRGRSPRPHRIQAMIGELRLNGELHTSEEDCLQIPSKLNKPGTNEALRSAAQVGARLTVRHEPFSELGAKIQWLRSGYLALFAVAGYQLALDPAMQIVREDTLSATSA